ncbi:MAG: sortase [Armatimonadetes bacterium]|nr:sortase [Armatimonadota bacterium]
MTRQRLNRLANLGIVLALLFGTLPFGMRAYGSWTQTQAKLQFEKKREQRLITELREDRELQPPKKTPPRKAWETSVVQIPSIGVDAVVIEGAGKWELVIGPGHLPGSAGAGGAGNCVIGAHRNLWDATFADLPKVKPGDKVYVITSKDRHTYVIDWSKEIRTSYKKPLRNTKDSRITLVTCVLPFDSHRRWVAQGHLVEE